MYFFFSFSVRVVAILFVFVFVFVFGVRVQQYQSIRLCIVSYKIFSPIFTRHCDRVCVRIRRIHTERSDPCVQYRMVYQYEFAVSIQRFKPNLFSINSFVESHNNICLLYFVLFDRIFRSVSLSCCTGSIRLSLHVVGILFVFVSVFVFVCRCDLVPVCVLVVLCPTVSIYPSLYCVIPDLFLSLYVLFLVHVVPDLFLSLYLSFLFLFFFFLLL